MKFQKLTLDHIKAIEPFFRYAQGRTCDYTVGGMFMWRDFFKMEYSIEDNVCFSKLHNEYNECYHNLPLCEDIKSAIYKILDENPCQTIKFCTIPESYLSIFKELGREISYSEQEIYFDYLYLIDDLRALTGKRFHGQKNHINKFIKDNPEWTFEEINNNNLPDVKDFFENKYKKQSEEETHASAIEENSKTSEVLDNTDKYNFIGGVLKINGSVVGFTFGEVVNDTLYVHIEKADKTIKGAYQMLSHQYLLQFKDENIIYVNREDDMGDMGLRTAKEAYHPIKLLKKYVVEVVNE